MKYHDVPVSLNIMSYDPKFIIDSETLSAVADIAALADRISCSDIAFRDLRLRRANRMRSIHSSLAIEGSTLSLEEVTDIIDGRKVAGDPKDIREVRNAARAYDLIDRLDPYSADDLLASHGNMLEGLIAFPGKLRDCDVGVYKGGTLVHKTPDPDDVPRLVRDLMEWVRTSDLHPLVKGCIFHCRLEYIHPFEDWNGRMGRLWHSLILSKWNPAFSYLPVESWVKLNQKEYYSTLSEAHRGNIDVFVRFMLRIILACVDELADEIAYAPKNSSRMENAILRMISDDPGSTAVLMAKALGVSTRTVKRYLSSMTEKEIIRRTGSDKTGQWEIIRPMQ